MTSAALHLFGRDALIAAWPTVTGAEATLPELQIAGAVAAFESGYGTANFHDNVRGTIVSATNNWGAVQCGHGPPCGTSCFEATDTSPNKITAANPRGEYQACFSRFATPAEGAAHFLRELTIRRPDSWAAMKAGDIDGFSAAMHTRHGSIGAYYEGFGATPAAQISNHAHAVETGVNEIAKTVDQGTVAAARGGGSEGSSDLTTAIACAGALGLLYWAMRRYS